MVTNEQIIKDFKKQLEYWCYSHARQQGETSEGPRVKSINVSEMEKPGVFMVSVEFP